MYQIFLGEMPLPLAPAKLTTTMGNRSTTIEIANGDEINLLKGGKLQEISFDFMIPAFNYPFLKGGVGGLAGSVLGSATGLVTGTAILAYLDNLKAEKKPFQFICVRLSDSLSVIGAHNTNIKVTLEDFTITEDANNGFDYMVSIRLKEWKEFGAKTLGKDGVSKSERVR